MAQSIARSSSQGLTRFCSRILQQKVGGELCLSGQCTRQPFLLKFTRHKSGGDVLAHSTLMLQDGLEIQELPLVIRRMTAREFPFSSAIYTGESLRKVTEQDETFKEQLRHCSNVPQVFSLLEVPGEQVTAYSAAFALQRICNLQAGSAGEIDSFISRAILNQLCGTVAQDISQLSNDAILSLVRCYLKSTSYDPKYVELFNREVEKRIGDGAFAIGEVCVLIDILAQHVHGDPDLLNSAWIHVGNRGQELNHSNIVQVYQSTLYLSPRQSYIWRVLDRRLRLCWWMLDGNEVSIVMQRMTMGNHYSGQIFGSFGKWLLMNIHEVTDGQLKDILTAYTFFKFSDPNVMRALERYVCSRIAKMNKTVVAMVMEYCRQRRFLSPRIFDCVAADFQETGHQYEAHEILNTLRPFGQLNYLPRNSTMLFSVIEEVLGKNFNEFDPASLVELMSSFVYVERFPVNFVKRIFTPHFLSRVRSVPHTPLRQRAGRHLLELQAAIILEFPRSRYVSYIDRDSFGLTLTWLESRYYRFHTDVGKVLSTLVGARNFKDVEVPRNTPHMIDFEVWVDEKKEIQKVGSSEKPHTKLALIGTMPEFYCVNTHHLLGEHAMKKRHLERMDYTVLEIPHEAFSWRCRTMGEKVRYLRRVLAPHLTIQ